MSDLQDALYPEDTSMDLQKNQDSSQNDENLSPESESEKYKIIDNNDGKKITASSIKQVKTEHCCYNIEKRLDCKTDDEKEQENKYIYQNLIKKNSDDDLKNHTEKRTHQPNERMSYWIKKWNLKDSASSSTTKNYEKQNDVITNDLTRKFQGARNKETIKTENGEIIDNKHINDLNTSDPRCENLKPSRNLKKLNNQNEIEYCNISNPISDESYECIQTPHRNSIVKIDEPSSSDNRSEDTYAEHKKHNVDGNSTTDSVIVKDLVIERFGNIINKFRRRSLKKKPSTKLQSESKDKIKQTPTQKIEKPKSLNINYANTNDTFQNQSSSSREPKTPDSGLDITNYSHSSKSDYESLQYSPTAFLREALGDRYMDIVSDSHAELVKKPVCSTPIHGPNKQNSTERSIGSSEISTLISTFDSLYSTIDKNKKKSSILKKASVSRSLFPPSASAKSFIYETIIEAFKKNEESKRISKHEELKHELFIQDITIVQILKALQLCKQSSEFLGSASHLEAEKHLLLATNKKELVEKELYRTYEQMDSEQCCGVINIENLTFHTKTQNVTQHYFICLIHIGINVLVSDVVLPVENGDIIFKQLLQFKDLASDFEMYIKLYSMGANTNAHKHKLFCSAPTKLHSQRKNEKVTTGDTEESSFQLLGESKLIMSDLFGDKTFIFKKVVEGDISDTFKADICSSVKLNNKIKGFLTIGTSSILWNRRWCVLDGSSLKYWNYPDAENHREPLEIIDLLDGINGCINSATKIVYSRPRTLTLTIISKRGSSKDYFLQADNIFEFQEWKRQLNSVLNLLDTWKCLKTTSTSIAEN